MDFCWALLGFTRLPSFFFSLTKVFFFPSRRQSIDPSIVAAVVAVVVVAVVVVAVVVVADVVVGAVFLWRVNIFLAPFLSKENYLETTHTHTHTHTH